LIGLFPSPLIDLKGFDKYSSKTGSLEQRKGDLSQEAERSLQSQGAKMAKYLQCSECGKLAFYYDDYVGTEKPFYKRFMRYPEGETKYELPRCFNCGGVPRLIHEFIKEEKAAAKH
jgi:hypothetical protein